MTFPSFPYNDLWQERTICSVANLTRRDGEEFLALAPKLTSAPKRKALPSNTQTTLSMHSAVER